MDKNNNHIGNTGLGIGDKHHLFDITSRYERRAVMITATQHITSNDSHRCILPFTQWSQCTVHLYTEIDVTRKQSSKPHGLHQNLMSTVKECPTRVH